MNDHVLGTALSKMLDRIDRVLSDSGYQGEPISMYLAGGMAVNFYCGTRYAEDVDASFSKRLLLPYSEMAIDYVKADGKPTFIYLNANYNTSFALMHEDFEDSCQEWLGIGNDSRKLVLKVLSPVDLAVSKIARYTEQDVQDILSLAKLNLFTDGELRSRATETLSYYVGNTKSVATSIDLICAQVKAVQTDAAYPIEGRR